MTHLRRGIIFSRDIVATAFQIRNDIRFPIAKVPLVLSSNSLNYFGTPVSLPIKASVRFCSSKKMVEKIPTREELKKILTPLQYHVTQEKGTERPFSGEFDKKSDAGTYVCLVCRTPLFSSKTKYDSGCGWPAFNDVLDRGLVKLSKDTSMGLVRTEVQCSRCDAHLGHVFDDGPLPTRKRFCINSASIDFISGDNK